MKGPTLEQIQEKFKYHTDRAFYFLDKQRRLPYNAHARRNNCRKLYLYHMDCRFKLMAETTGAAVQTTILPL